MTAIGQGESDVRVGELMDLVDRPPRRDMVAFCTDRKHWHAKPLQGDGPAIHHEPAICEIIIDVEFLQILRMHPVGHARRIGVPGDEIEHRRPLAHHVFPDETGPEQVVRAEQLERPGHFVGRQETAIPHDAFKEMHLAVVDEEGELAWLTEIGLCRQQRDRSQPVVAIACHRCGGDGEQGPAKAITGRVDFPVRANGINRVERIHHAHPAIVVQRQVAVIGRGIAPRNDEDGEALLGQVLHH